MNDKQGPEFPETGLGERIAKLSPESGLCCSSAFPRRRSGRVPGRAARPWRSSRYRAGGICRCRLRSSGSGFSTGCYRAAARTTCPTAWRLEGPLEVEALARSVAAVVARHEALRTRVVLRAGAPVQVIDPAPSEVLQVTDLSALAPAAREAARECSPRRTRASRSISPRGRCFARSAASGGRGARAAVNVHHIASDGWSVGVFRPGARGRLRRVRRRAAEPLFPPLPIQYADYAVWQRAWLQGPVLAAQRAYWQPPARRCDDPGVADRPAAPAGAELPGGAARVGSAGAVGPRRSRSWAGAKAPRCS